jgi:hypothetical protein
MVDSWLLMGSPKPLLLILGAYLTFVLKIGPKMMEKRPAFELKTVIILYNGFQVLFSIWLTILVRKCSILPLKKRMTVVYFFNVCAWGGGGEIERVGTILKMIYILSAGTQG